jgi:hypothetical protein
MRTSWWARCLCSVAAMVLIQACESDPGEPDISPSFMTPEGCEILPEQCPSRYPPEKPLPDFSGNLHNFNLSTSLNEPLSPADPSPGADGIWLALHRQDCWATFYLTGSSHPDRDADGFDDNCELRLAQAFAPMLNFSSTAEGCKEGEAYWAAKFFDNLHPFETGDFVRIAYLLPYYRDCGTLGHNGDAEFVQLTVTYIPLTKHWKLINSWISAHAVMGEPVGNDFIPGVFDSNTSSWGSSFEWPSGRRYSYPRIWISQNKHGDYRSKNACDTGGLLLGAFETCSNAPRDYGRFRVWSGNNIGSYHRQLKNCVPSMKNAASPVECFWTGSDFDGWASTGGGSRFIGYLNSIVYGCFYMTSGMCWGSRWGM